MTGPIAALLPDGRRLHLQHGPIDLIVEAFGAPSEIFRCYRQAARRFATVLEELVDELPRLRTVHEGHDLGLRGSIARRMEMAVRSYASEFVTPMAAVAGAVADECLEAAIKNVSLDKAYINNGGDIALYLGRDAWFELGLIIDPGIPEFAGRISLGALDGITGVATSGRHGRSLSLGIADSVTVLARSASEADVAATMIANAVDLPGHPKVRRTPARGEDPDSDLGDRLVTVDVAELTSDEEESALARGAERAETYLEKRLIAAAVLCLGDGTRFIGDDGAQRPTLFVPTCKTLQMGGASALNCHA